MSFVLTRVVSRQFFVIAGVSAIALLVMARSQPHAQVSGLVASYSFNEGTGTSVADSSGHNLTGTVSGATWTNGGRYGKALQFNGTSSYVDLGNPTALQLTGSMTLEAWINAAANPADDGQIVAKSNSVGWELKTSPDTGPHTFGFAVSPSSTTHTQQYTTTVRSLNTWYHFAGVYDATARTMSTYVNGALDNGTLSGTVPASQFNQSVNVNIGRRTGGFYFNGIIDEVRIYSRALSQTEIQNDMNTPIGPAGPPDTTPPTVTITSPTDGATVQGTINVTVSANDNVGVAGVQYLIDGAALGSEVLTPPFTLPWNTATSTTGTHTLGAIARDFAGNTATSPNVSITVQIPSPAQVGQWSAVNTWPIVAVHAALLPTGNVLAWTDYTANAGAQLWRPGSNTFVPETYNPVSLFCSALSFLADGRLFVSGGIVGLQDDLGPRDTTIFNPVTESWSAGAFMNTGRYYPTTTTLGDGRVFVNGGTTTCVSCIADIPEIFDPVTNRWTSLANTARLAFQYYPHNYQLPDGRILVAAQDDRAIASTVLDLTTQKWTTVDSRIIDGHSSVMYLPGKVLKSGTATADNPGQPSARTSYTLDMTQPSPTWQATGTMAFPRSFHNLTVLPDGQVLVTGGGVTTDPADHSKAVYEAELWSPATRNWVTMSRSQIPRQYHSTALLMPDATVLVAGGGRQNGRSQPDPADEPNAEIFSPPYLFKGPRPAITSAPSLIPYNSAFTIGSPDASRIASVSFIALGAVTHAFNENQRFVTASFQISNNSLTVQSPANGNIAPPGPYMLFIVDTNGVPSTAAMVRFPAPYEDSRPPSAPTNLTATASTGVVNLAWQPSTDDVGVTGYNVHRSTTSGFVPGGSNRIAQVTGTSYADTTFSSAGTYYYQVTAYDLNGNVSAPSNEASAAATPDTAAPAVAITAPANGATVSGVTALTASASDNVVVAGVQFLLDGGAIGAEVTGAGPTYTLNWSSTSTVNGSHTLSARARDAAGNTTTAASIAVLVSNATPDGLVASYGFSEGTGTSVADSSGHGLTGTISGATWTTSGRYGKALQFNGTSSFVNLANPTALRLTGSMTIEAWVNASADPAGDAEIVSKSSGFGWELKTTKSSGPQTFGLQVSPTSTTTTLRTSASARSLNTWYHIAGVYDATARTMSTYVNGVLANGSLTGTVPASQYNPSANVNIGRRTNGLYFTGIIDEVRIYNRVLSQTEIQIDLSTPINPDGPTVTSVSPNSGSSDGGTAVTIAGTNFAPGAALSIGGTPAIGVTVVSSTSITATTPAHAVGAVSVIVTNPDTKTGTLSNGFTYLGPAPSVGGVVPASGSTAGGTSVTISGSNFMTGATATIGGAAATALSVVNANTITALTPAHAAGAAAVIVTNPDAQSASLSNAFLYVAPPTVTGVSPNVGPAAGGTSVTITGSNFVTGATVNFGGVPASDASVVSATSITATTPAHASGPVSVTITNPDAQSGSLPNGFTYRGPAPAATGVTPGSGPTAGGTTITIAGSNFVSGATVSVGGVAATSVTVVDAATITARTPAHAAGAVDVTVTNPDTQGATLTGAFVYVAPPAVTGVAPPNGPVAGGTSVTITGSNFVTGATVSIGGIAAADATVQTPTSITATTPAHAAGAVSVSVTNPDGQSATLVGGFAYLGQAPSLTGVTPGSGSTAGGTAVTIGGANFVAGATITIGGTAATNVVVVDAATITAQTPAHAAGSANVTITNPDTQSATLTGAFTFIAPPSVTSVSPSSGPLAGGTSVTITGANFAAGATVTIGGTAATNVTVVSATSITATTPAHAAGQTAVTVTNSNGLSGSLTNGFTYSSAITFVQAVAAVPQATQTTVSATYPAAQTAGDLNVVIVGWDNTTTAVQSVVDSRGNAYQLAIGPTSGNGRRQSIYYASGIASGANTVTVTFSAAAPFPDLRLLQYRGVTTFDVAAGATGTNATSSSGSATTTAGAALIVGANVVATSTSGAGTGFTSRIITSPNGSIAEDRIVSAPGTYSATAPLSGAGGWVMQMVIFK